MSDYRVANRYAKSLLELSIEKGVLEEVHADMQLFTQVCDENRDFSLMLKKPIIKHLKKLTILRKIFEGKVNELTFAFFDIITRKNREAVLYTISQVFHDLYNAHKGIVKARVTTTFSLDKELRSVFEAAVKEITGKDAELQQEVEEDIIGGFQLTIEDRQIDESIRSKLKGLKLKFSAN